MSDLSITATSVLLGTGAQKATAIAGATISAGEAIYLDGSNLVQLCQASSSITANAAGIALNGGVAGQPISYCTSGLVTMGATLTKAGIYCVAADTAGSITLQSGLSTGNYVTYLGYAPNTTQLLVNIQNAGITSP